MDPNSNQQQINQNQQVQNPMPVSTQESTPSKKNNINLIIFIILGFMLILILGIAGFWYLNNQQKQDSEQIQNVEVNQNVTPAASEEEIQDTQGLEEAVNQLGQEDEGLQSEIDQLQQDANF
jgi:uncharacterized protein HemX